MSKELIFLKTKRWNYYIEGNNLWTIAITFLPSLAIFTKYVPEQWKLSAFLSWVILWGFVSWASFVKKRPKLSVTFLPH